MQQLAQHAAPRDLTTPLGNGLVGYLRPRVAAAVMLVLLGTFWSLILFLAATTLA